MDVCNVLPVVAQMLVKTVHSVAYVRYDVHTQNADRFFFLARSKYSFVLPVKISVVVFEFIEHQNSVLLYVLEHEVCSIQVPFRAINAGLESIFILFMIFNYYRNF